MLKAFAYWNTKCYPSGSTTRSKNPSIWTLQEFSFINFVSFSKIKFLVCSFQAYVFEETSGVCAAFLVNNDERKAVTVLFRNISYELPRKSISILPDCKTVAFNTERVRLQATLISTVIEEQDWYSF